MIWVVVTTDQEGNIVSLEADIVEVNRLKAGGVHRYTGKTGSAGKPGCAGSPGRPDRRGLLYRPRTAADLPSVHDRHGSLTNLTSSFTSAGINQTRHEILLDVQMNLSVVLSDRVQTIPLHTEFLVAETILKGEVPSVYGSGWGLLGAGAEISEE